MPNPTPASLTMLNANKDTPRQHKQRLERNIIYGSILIQMLLTTLVVGFCVNELSRCPVNSADIDNGGTCPRALYTNILTGTVAFWFPSPYYAIISGLYGITGSSGESGARSVRKKTSVEEGIEEDALK